MLFLLIGPSKYNSDKFNNQVGGKITWWIDRAYQQKDASVAVKWQK